jgi:hypothetical protein
VICRRQFRQKQSGKNSIRMQSKSVNNL